MLAAHLRRLRWTALPDLPKPCHVNAPRLGLIRFLLDRSTSNAKRLQRSLVYRPFFLFNQGHSSDLTTSRGISTSSVQLLTELRAFIVVPLQPKLITIYRTRPPPIGFSAFRYPSPAISYFIVRSRLTQVIVLISRLSPPTCQSAVAFLRFAPAVAAANPRTPDVSTPPFKDHPLSPMASSLGTAPMILILSCVVPRLQSQRKLIFM